MQRFTEIYSRPSIAWDQLGFLRERTRLPILLKGILHPDDAARAIDSGMDGIVVSNHGGRQVDGSIATLEALPAIVRSVAGQIPILLDSGIRGGADAFKALALGADAVLIGRPYVFGLAIAGRVGVREVILNLRADFELTMGLAGCRSVAEIDADTLVAARCPPPPRADPLRRRLTPPGGAEPTTGRAYTWPVTARGTDWGLAALVALLVATGALTLFAGGSSDAWVFAVHDAGAAAIAALLVVKLRRVWPRLSQWDSRHWAGVGAAGIALAALVSGLLWGLGITPVAGGLQPARLA